MSPLSGPDETMVAFPSMPLLDALCLITAHTKHPVRPPPPELVMGSMNKLEIINRRVLGGGWGLGEMRRLVLFICSAEDPILLKYC